MTITRFSIRWTAIPAVGAVIVFLAICRYQNEVAPITIETFAAYPEEGVVRVVGQISAGSITSETDGRSFDLAGEKRTIRVRYVGPENDDLRDLKTLVVIGKWSAAGHVLIADRIAPTPNAEFVVAAYIVGLVPLAFFLFRMERSVERLYREIKEETVYIPETLR